MKTKKLICLGVAAALAASLCSCGGKQTSKTNGAQSELPETKYGDTYPIQSDKTLTMWTHMPVDPQYTNLGDMPMFQELKKRTGINVEYKSPIGAHKEQFNLLIASGDYPDIIGYDWFVCMGNPSKPIEDNIIIPLNDVIDKYAPNLKGLLEKYPNQAKQHRTDEGIYFGFPGLTSEEEENWESLSIYQGPIINETLFEKYNIEKPTTIDEWHKALTTLKDNGVKYPLSIEGKSLKNPGHDSFLFGAYNTCYGYYIDDDGKVTYGPIEPAFKEALMTYNKWYEEGLLDAEFVSTDGTLIQRKITDGSAAATIGYVSRIALWGIESEFNYGGVPYPTLNKGEKPEFGQLAMGGGYAYYNAISTQCEDIELAAKYLDYSYTEEGARLHNYGIEGVTYEMVDGVEVFHDDILENFEKVNPYSVLFASVSEKNRADQRNRLPAQQEALVTWKTNMEKHGMPAVTPTAEESDMMAEYDTEIQTYVEEMVLKFITGNESFDNYDAFVANIKALGIDEVIASKQAQLERFENR